MRSFLLITFLIVSASTFSQDLLLLEKVNGRKRIRFIEKQEIQFTYRDTSGQVYMDGYINKIGKDSLMVNGELFAYGDMLFLEKSFKKRRLANTFRRFFAIGGRVYFLFSTTNRVLNNDSPTIHKSALIALGVGETLNLFLKYVPRPRYNLKNGKWRLRTLDFSSAQEEE